VGQKPILVYHASEVVVQTRDIKLPEPRDNCDFGAGFYVAASKQTAEEWVKDSLTPQINVYGFDEQNTKVLHLQGQDWVHVVVGFRTKKYKVHFKSSVIKGIIADDRIDVSLPFFMRGEIGDLRLLKCLDFCNFGNQYLFRDSTVNLMDAHCYTLKGQELHRAQARNSARKQGMMQALQNIRRQPIPGELFIEDYIRKGDFVEPGI